jgi:hypothetical protein
VIEIPRTLARDFRVVLRRAVMTEAPRGPWPLVCCRAGKEGLVLEAEQVGVALRYQADEPRPEDHIAFRPNLLAEIEGRHSDPPVVLEEVSPGKGRARWAANGESLVRDFDTIKPDSLPPFPALPKQFTPQPPEFLTALDEAARTAARDTARYSLLRVQLRGKSGSVVGTDGRQLLLQSGFTFPWEDNVLVPRVAAFGCRELAGAGQVSVGRTKTHVAIRAGPWTVLLSTDATGRYPNAEDVIPRARANTSRLQVSPEDAALLIRVLPELPGREDEQSPVTLDLGMPPTVRAQDGQRGAVQEAMLAGSTTVGPAVRLCMDRRYLRRALQLGFTEVQVFKAEQPLVCRDDQRTYVWMPLSEQGALPPSKEAVRVQEPIAAESNPSPPTERRTEPMPANSNGQGPPEGRDGANQPGSMLDPITEAEALRGLLHEAASRSTRLVAALKQQRRQTRVLQQAVQSIRQLPLDR